MSSWAWGQIAGEIIGKDADGNCKECGNPVFREGTRHCTDGHALKTNSDPDSGASWKEVICDPDKYKWSQQQ